MLKYCVLLACVAFVAVCAAPAPERTEQDVERKFVPIINSEINKNDDGSYNLQFEGGDGTKRQEEATIVDAGTEDEALEVKGSYKYINEDGDEVEVFYTAGKNGFVPYGSIINPEITATAEKAKDLPNEYDEEREKQYSKKKVATY